MLSNWWQRLYSYLPIVFIIIICVLLFGKTLYPESNQIIYGGDLLTQFYYWKGYLVSSLKNGIIPFWNPYNFSGTPFLAHPSTAFFYPSTLLFVFLPLNGAFSASIFLHYLIGAIGMYFLGKHYGGILSGFAAGVLIALSGVFSARVYAGHVDILSTLVWVPWVYLSALLFLENPIKKHWCFFIIVLSLQILASYQAVVLFTLELVFLRMAYQILAVYIFAQKGKRFFRKHIYIILSLILAIGVSFLLTAVSWIPTYELVKQSIRGIGLPYQLASFGSLPVSALRLFWDPYDKLELAKITYSLSDGLLPNFFAYYMGKVSLLIIIIAALGSFLPGKLIISRLIDLKKMTSIWFYIGAALFYIYVSFGHNVFPNIHLFLFQIFPFYRFIRIPDQHLLMVGFIFCVIIAVFIGSLKNVSLKFLIISLIILELFSYSKKVFFLTTLPQLHFDKKLIENLDSGSSIFRTLPDVRVAAPVKDIFEFNSPYLYKIYSTSGYDPIILYSYYRFIGLLNKSSDTLDLIPLYNVEIPTPNPNSKLVDFLNIRTIILGANYVPQGIDWNRLKSVTSSRVYSLYRNMYAFSRFYFVPKVAIFPNESELEQALMGENVDLAKMIAITQKEDSELPQNIVSDCFENYDAKVDVLSYKPNEIIINTDSSCNGFLSTSEVYYPGWQASIDRRPGKILRSNIAFKSIYLPQGKHSIKLYYVPTVYYIGCVVTLITILIVFIVYISFDKLGASFQKDRF